METFVSQCDQTLFAGVKTLLVSVTKLLSCVRTCISDCNKMLFGVKMCINQSNQTFLVDVKI